MKAIILSFAILCITNGYLYAQCDTGSEPECMCETAEVLCSISELNGFSSSMSNFQHPDDGPTPFCGPQTQTNNPTWFAFIAWCEDISMDFDFANCTTVGSFSGVQLAIYTDCTFNDQIDCSQECNSSSNTATIEMFGLTIGESYYVMLDGCFGSACDYEISVSPTDCDEFIEDWDDPVTEDESVCVGQTILYEVENLTGATSWHWYLDGDELEITDNPNYSITWDTEGVYELCVDVSNICVEVEEDPELNCVMITVGNPDAGEIEAEENPSCPQEAIEIEIVEYNMGEIYNQVMIIVDMNGEVVYIMEDADEYDFNWPTCGEFIVYSLNYATAEDIPLPDIGDLYSGTDCTFYCCDETFLDIFFVDDDFPQFDTYPQDITVECYYLLEELGLDEAEEVESFDNCEEDQEIIPLDSIQADTCNGGSIIRSWYYEDACGNSVSHTQTITILPLIGPTYINPLPDTSMTSIEYEAYVIPTLMYDNGQAGSCQMSGFVSPIVEDNRSGCGGSVSHIYSFTDSCGRTIIDTQLIEIITDITIQETFLIICDNDSTGIVEITRSDLDSLIAQDLTNIMIDYYPTESDLEAGTNIITFPITSEMLPEAKIYASVIDGSGCESALAIDIIISSPPVLVASGVSESCLGQGDGMIQITSPANPIDYTILLESDTILSTLIEDLVPGIYALDIIDSLGCIATDTIVISEGINLSFENLLINCNNNGTGLDETDDYYEISFVVTGGMGQYNLLAEPALDLGTFNYDELVSINLNADGNPNRLTAVDALLTCEVSVDIFALNHCSTDCSLSLDQWEYECNDNGTPLDGTDDYYEFNLTVSAVNGDVSNTYHVYLDNILSYTFNYSESSSFTLPSTGIEVNVFIEDFSQSSCNLSMLTDNLVSCSNLCQLQVEEFMVECIDPGTPAVSEDDLFEVTILVSAINASSSFMISGITGLFNYDEQITIGSYLIQDGNIQLEILDSEDQTCLTLVDISPPSPCSTPCDLELSSIIIQDCNDNMTGMIDDDDYFYIELSISNLLGGGQNYVLSDDSGNQYGPFDYSLTNLVGPFPASGQTITLDLNDLSNASCTLSIDILQQPCSECIHSLNLDASNMILNCLDNTSILTANSINPITNYSWTGPGNFVSDMEEIEVTMEGEYILLATFADGCTLSENILIGASLDVPVSNAGDDLLLNCDIETVILDGSMSQFGTGAIFNWLDENGNIISEDQLFNISEPGTYGLQLIDTFNHCVSQIDYVEVSQNLHDPLIVVYAEPDDFLDCIITSVILSYDSEPNTVYFWNLDEQQLSNETLTITQPQTVGLVAIDTISQCDSDTSIVIGDFEIYPQITLETIETIDCFDEMACVTATSYSFNPVEYNWYNQAGELISNAFETYCFTSGGEYTLELIDMSNGCANSENFEIIEPVYPEVDLPATIVLINEETGIITPTINVNESALASISWETNAVLSCYDCLTPSILQVSDSTVVSLTIITHEGCSASDELLIQVKRIPKIFVPNIFDPLNEENLTIYSSSDITLIDELQIYDRWGNLVFENKAFPPNDTSFGWDGRVKDGPLIQGVYVYRFQYKHEGRTELSFGSITLIK